MFPKQLYKYYQYEGWLINSRRKMQQAVKQRPIRPLPPSIPPDRSSLDFGAPGYGAGKAFSLQLPERAPAWPASPSVRRQLTPEEWESLKPVIIKLYMNERKTFRQLANILRQDHNFHPT
jgi:hypothetical protein